MDGNRGGPGGGRVCDGQTEEPRSWLGNTTDGPVAYEVVNTAVSRLHIVAHRSYDGGDGGDDLMHPGARFAVVGVDTDVHSKDRIERGNTDGQS